MPYFLLLLMLAGCGQGSRVGTQLAPVTAAPAGWTTVVSKLIQFYYPDPKGAGPTQVEYFPEQVSTKYRDFMAPPDNISRTLTGLEGEHVVLLAEGRESTDAEACQSWKSEAAAGERVASSPLIFHQDETDDFKDPATPDKFVPYHKFSYFFDNGYCAVMVVRDATLMGYDHRVSLDDATEAGSFLRNVAGSVVFVGQR